MQNFSSSQFCARAEWLVRLAIKEPAGNWGACGARIGYKPLSGKPLSLPCVSLCNPDDFLKNILKPNMKHLSNSNVTASFA